LIPRNYKLNLSVRPPVYARSSFDILQALLFKLYTQTPQVNGSITTGCRLPGSNLLVTGGGQRSHVGLWAIFLLYISIEALNWIYFCQGDTGRIQ